MGALGGNYFRMESPTFGMSSSGRVGHSLPAEGRSCFCRDQFLLFAQNEDSSCFSPKNRYHIDIAKVRGAKATFSTSGIECFRRRPRTFQASDFR